MGNQLDLTCKICNLECHSEADFLNHMEGKKHKKKVAKHDRNSASANHDLSDKSRGNNEKISLKSSKSIEEDYRNANHQKPLHKKGDENTFLIYPSADANDAVTIKIEDLRRLRPGAKLNDSIIDFWMRVMWENLDEKNKKYHQYFQTYFFQTIQKESIKKWTLRRKYSIFESNFLHIPINYADHWVVIVLCNLSTLIRNSKQPFSEEMTDGVANDPSPCILFMDSLGIKHGKELSSTLEVEKKIYSYLAQEYNSKKKKEESIISFNSSTMPLIHVKVPFQTNYIDCGLFMLLCISHLLAKQPNWKNLDAFFGRKWFEQKESDKLRATIKTELHHKKEPKKAYEDSMSEEDYQYHQFSDYASIINDAEEEREAMSGEDENNMITCGSDEDFYDSNKVNLFNDEESQLYDNVSSPSHEIEMRLSKRKIPKGSLIDSIDNNVLKSDSIRDLIKDPSSLFRKKSSTAPNASEGKGMGVKYFKEISKIIEVPDEIMAKSLSTGGSGKFVDGFNSIDIILDGSLANMDKNKLDSVTERIEKKKYFKPLEIDFLAYSRKNLFAKNPTHKRISYTVDDSSSLESESESSECKKRSREEESSENKEYSWEEEEFIVEYDNEAAEEGSSETKEAKKKKHALGTERRKNELGNYIGQGRIGKNKDPDYTVPKWNFDGTEEIRKEWNTAKKEADSVSGKTRTLEYIGFYSGNDSVVDIEDFHDSDDICRGHSLNSWEEKGNSEEKIKRVLQEVDESYRGTTPANWVRGNLFRTVSQTNPIIELVGVEKVRTFRPKRECEAFERFEMYAAFPMLKTLYLAIAHKTFRKFQRALKSHQIVEFTSAQRSMGKIAINDVVDFECTLRMFYSFLKDNYPKEIFTGWAVFFSETLIFSFINSYSESKRKSNISKHLTFLIQTLGKNETFFSHFGATINFLINKIGVLRPRKSAKYARSFEIESYSIRLEKARSVSPDRKLEFITVLLKRCKELKRPGDELKYVETLLTLCVWTLTIVTTQRREVFEMFSTKNVYFDDVDDCFKFKPDIEEKAPRIYNPNEFGLIFPRALTPLIRHYLGVIRPKFLNIKKQAVEVKSFWINSAGNVMLGQLMLKYHKNVTQEFLGYPMTILDARHVYGTHTIVIANQKKDQMERLAYLRKQAALAGHTVETLEFYYNDDHGESATQRHQLENLNKFEEQIKVDTLLPPSLS